MTRVCGSHSGGLSWSDFLRSDYLQVLTLKTEQLACLREETGCWPLKHSPNSMDKKRSCAVFFFQITI